MELDVKSKSPLNWAVFVTPGIPVATSDVPPGQKQRTFSPISSTQFDWETVSYSK
jgi:hypothetical protein